MLSRHTNAHKIYDTQVSIRFYSLENLQSVSLSFGSPNACMAFFYSQRKWAYKGTLDLIHLKCFHYCEQKRCKKNGIHQMQEMWQFVVFNTIRIPRPPFDVDREKTMISQIHLHKFNHLRQLVLNHSDFNALQWNPLFRTASTCVDRNPILLSLDTLNCNRITSSNCVENQVTSC